MREKNITAIGLQPSLSARGETRPTLCVLHGPEPGRVYVLSGGSTLIGRAESAGVVVDSQNVSRRHATVVVIGGQVEILDLGSTNGTRVNGEIIREARVLLEGDRVQVGNAVFKFTYQDDLEANLRSSLYASAVRDRLTGIHNRAFFNERWTQAFSLSLREGSPLALALLDLDHFKRVNDTYGHCAGDSVLKAAALAMRNSVRREDTLARYGGEEFAVILPGAQMNEAIGVAQRIGEAVSRVRVAHQGIELAVTVSVGVAERIYGGHDTPEAVLSHADALLYEAKSAGRNCTRYRRAA